MSEDRNTTREKLVKQFNLGEKSNLDQFDRETIHLLALCQVADKEDRLGQEIGDPITTEIGTLDWEKADEIAVSLIDIDPKRAFQLAIDLGQVGKEKINIALDIDNAFPNSLDRPLLIKYLPGIAMIILGDEKMKAHLPELLKREGNKENIAVIFSDLFSFDIDNFPSGDYGELAHFYNYAGAIAAAYNFSTLTGMEDNKVIDRAKTILADDQKFAKFDWLKNATDTLPLYTKLFALKNQG